MNPPSKKKCVPIFSEEDADLAAKSWRSDPRGYARRTFSGANDSRVTRYAHHVVCVRVFGRKPDHKNLECCDHVNRNRLDNRRENIRIVSCYENNLNRRNSSPWPHAYQLKSGRWRSQIKFSGKIFYLGIFETPEEASKAASAKRVELLGKETP